uniref:Aminotransferase class V domain-containing protein n=1 Tax=Corethron hystrix TaxID=216773 RepID=A0A7S1FQ63_9STRA
MLSHPYHAEDDDASTIYPVYLLEINAPPSQDTATGLPHAEEVHDAVLRDLLTLLVLPAVTGSAPQPGGWIPCDTAPSRLTNADGVVPSKAALLNRMRWALTERRRRREDEIILAQLTEEDASPPSLPEAPPPRRRAGVGRAHCPYFAQPSSPVFFENAGGTQVPLPVTRATVSSLCHRHRANEGRRWNYVARETLRRLLAAPDDAAVILGPNASRLLADLAARWEHLLSPGDVVVVADWNHVANVTPWERAAQNAGATLRRWPMGYQTDPPPGLLDRAVSVVAVGHASNVEGEACDLPALVRTIRKLVPHAAIVVDGVAAFPHIPARFGEMEADWYVAALHKACGPVAGVLVGTRNAAAKAAGNSQAWEPGTDNFEACAGIVGMGEYFSLLAEEEAPPPAGTEGQDTAQVNGASPCLLSFEDLIDPEAQHVQLSPDTVEMAYRVVREAERELLAPLLNYVRGHPRLHVLERGGGWCHVRLPIVSVVHSILAAEEIVGHCRRHGVVCRGGTFLSPRLFESKLVQDLCPGVWPERLREEGAVRFSLLHYNTVEEVRRLVQVLEKIEGW